MKGKKKMPISLIERVQSINRMNNAEREENKEQKVEQSMVEAVEQSWENAKAEEKKEVHTEVTIEMLYLEIQALTEVVEKQAEELKKINKHINATQKMLKKGVK